MPRHSLAVQIAVAANEQAGTTQEVNQHMHHLHDVTRDNRQNAAHTRSSGEYLQQVANNQSIECQRKPRAKWGTNEMPETKKP